MYKKFAPNKIERHCVLALILILAITFLASIQTATSEVINLDTYAVVILAPNTIGVNQDVLVSFRIDKIGVGTTVRTNLFEGFMMKITKPDGTIETKGPFTADATSGAWFLYRPTMVGTYNFQFTFPGMWINTTQTQRWYKPSTSSIAQLIVQAEPLLPYDKSPPLPTGYWTRPIYAENKNWWQIADNWLSPSVRSRYTGVFSPYTSAPDSPHVLWIQPRWFGGIGGGQFGDIAYYTGLSYEENYKPQIICGRILYTINGPTSASVYGTRCIDLYTGEQIWYLPDVNMAFAQVLDIETANEHGLIAYFWSISGTTWSMYDAFSGQFLLNVTGMPSSGTREFGPNGEVLIYVLSGPTENRQLTMWNLTRAIGGEIFDTWSPTYQGTINASRPMSTNSTLQAQMQAQSNSPYYGVEWNVTLPNVGVTQSILAIGEGYILARNTNTASYPYNFTDMAYNIGSIKRDSNYAYPTQLRHLWVTSRTDIYTPSQRPINIHAGVYTFSSNDKAQVHGYSITTGRELWVSESLPGWGMFNVLSHAAYGKVYYTGFDGHVRAYDAQSGRLVWDYYCGNAGLENAYGSWPINNGITIADGKVFITNDEHSPDSVMWRGGKLHVIDAETGEGLWNLTGWIRLPAISDGILTAVNAYDNQIYTIGKGPSKVTVSAPQTVVPHGTGVLITGTVTDQSPASKDTPAISDLDIAAWMEYLHMQKVMPQDATGVEVKLTAIDPNGNSQTIGTTTTNVAGSFGISWTPPVEGTYMVTATFEGTNSYGGSYDMTYFVVGPAAAAAAPQPTATPQPTAAPSTAAPTATPSPSVVPEPEAAPSTEMYIIAVAASAIIVVIAVSAVFLKKRL